MLSFSFTVGSADDARIAADVCDLLAERMTDGAVQSPRRARRQVGKVAELAASFTGDAGQTETLPASNDPAAIYAALGGAMPAATETPAETPVSVVPFAQPTPATPTDREAAITAARTAASAKGAKWYGDYLKAHVPTGKKLSEFTDAEIAHLHAAAIAP